MKLGGFGNWLQVSGNLAVLVGLVFVGLQLLQDRELKRAEMTWQVIDNQREQYFAMLGEEPHKAFTKAVYHPDDLTDEDVVILHSFFRIEALRLTQVSAMVRLGILSDSVQQGVGLSGFFETKIGQAWLDADRLAGMGLDDEYISRELSRRQSPNAAREFLESLRTSGSSNPK